MRGLAIIVALVGASSVIASGCSAGNGKPRDAGGEAAGVFDGGGGDAVMDAVPSPDVSVSPAQSFPGVVLWLEARLGISTGGGQPVAVLWRD